MILMLNNQKLQLKNVQIYSTDTEETVKFEYSMTQHAPVNRFIIQEELVSWSWINLEIPEPNKVAIKPPPYSQLVQW